MPTILPKTGIKITRITQSLSNPGDGVNQTTQTIYIGLARVVDISSNSNFDKYFPTGLQESKRFLVYLEPSWSVKTDDIVEFDYLLMGDNKSFVDSTTMTKLKILVPIKSGTLKILGVKRIEAFCISFN